MACLVPSGGHKNGDAQKKRSSRKVRGVSPEAGRESMVGKICERGRSNSVIGALQFTTVKKAGLA